MSTRQRLTWRGRQASPPPATPGYDEAGREHPASQPDPGKDDYNIGGPSEFGEDVFPPPYKNSAPPATPGYDEAGKEHPASKKATLEQQVQRKAAKCLRLASAMLGPKASQSAIEDQALDLMDLSDRQIATSLKRLAGDFLACGEPMAGQNAPDEFYTGDPAGGTMAGEDFDDDDILGQDEMVDDDSEMLARLMAEEEGEQGDLFGGLDSEDDAQIDTGAMAQMDMPMDMGMDMPMEQDALLGRRYASLGFDRDGFATKREWRGNRNVFAAVDTDADGIITLSEYKQAMWGGEKTAQFDGLDSEEADMLSSMLDEAAGMPVMASDDEDEDDAPEATPEEDAKDAKKAAARRKAKKADDDEDADDEAGDEDAEEMTAKKKATLRRLAEEEAEGEEEEVEESDDEGTEKEASIFSMTADPMGLSGYTTLSSQDDALLAEIFGGKTASDDEDADDAEGDSDPEEDAKEAKKAAARRKAKKADDDEDADDEAGDEDEGEVTAKKKKAALPPEFLKNIKKKDGEDDEDEDDEKAEKKASLRPRPRKPSQGVKSVGQMTKAASAGSSEINELSKLWNSAPDVSEVFKS